MKAPTLTQPWASLVARGSLSVWEWDAPEAT